MVRAAFLSAATAARSSGATNGARVLPNRTEISAAQLAAICTREAAEALGDLRQRAVTTMVSSFDVPGYPELSLLSEMRVGDAHVLHADAERQAEEGWAPNHTSWRTHVGLLYLNTCGVDYEGGVLRLPVLGKEFQPQEGLFVAFPSDHRYVHEVSPVLAGSRLTMAVWVTGDASRVEPWGRTNLSSVGRLPRHRDVAPHERRAPDASAASGLLVLGRAVVTEAVTGAPTNESVTGKTVDEPTATGPGRVNLDVYVDRTLRASTMGEGGKWEEAVRQAGVQAAADIRFGGRLQPEELGDMRLELWVQTASDEIGVDDDLGRELDLGLDGVELHAANGYASSQPSLALTDHLTRPDQLLQNLALSAGLAPDAWLDPDAQIKRTTWEHFAVAPGAQGGAVRLRRLRAVEVGPLTLAALERSAGLSVDRLMAVQQPAGHYQYSMHPFTNRHDAGAGNLVRQAGCAYAMARMAEVAGGVGGGDRGAALTESASRAVDALLARGIDMDGTLILAEPSTTGTPWGKLGTVALTLAALQEPAVGHSRGQWRARLTETILRWQRPSGSFRSRSDSASETDDQTGQEYFTGQALMALVEEAHRGSPVADEAVSRAFPWCRDHFADHPTSGFVLWQAVAWAARAYHLLGSKGTANLEARACAEFVWEIADWISQFQLAASDSHPDLAGGFSEAGGRPTCSASCYVEAIVAAHDIACSFGDEARAARYGTSARLGLDFVRRLQLSPETGFLFPDPARTVGATTKSLHDLSLRCDFDQHTITCLHAASTSRWLLSP